MILAILAASVIAGDCMQRDASLHCVIMRGGPPSPSPVVGVGNVNDAMTTCSLHPRAKEGFRAEAIVVDSSFMLECFETQKLPLTIATDPTKRQEPFMVCRSRWKIDPPGVGSFCKVGSGWAWLPHDER